MAEAKKASKKAAVKVSKKVAPKGGASPGALVALKAEFSRINEQFQAACVAAQARIKESIATKTLLVGTKLTDAQLEGLVRDVVGPGAIEAVRQALVTDLMALALKARR